MQNAGQGSTAELNHAARPLRAPTSRAVRLFADGDDLVRLQRMIEQLNHHVVIGNVTEGTSAAVAVISDRVDTPLDLCHALSGRCPTILISDEPAFAFRLAAVRAGVAAIIRRPINPTEISEWLVYLSALETPADVSVLIVDDDWLAAEINAAVLRSDGMTVTTVMRSGQGRGGDRGPRAGHRADGHANARRSAAWSSRKVIRQSMHFVSLPIIFLSAERDEDRQLAARRQGGDDFIIKPIQPDMLVSLVRMRADRSKLLRSFIERDRLTGLFDQTRFKERVAHEMERCRRTGAEIALATIDLDHFKQVNDVHGHGAGDDVLRTLADLLGTNLRKIDIVGRCGGEEFGVILLDTGLKDAARTVNALRERFREIAFPGRQAPFRRFTSAPGLASSRDCGDIAVLMASADAALYGAKRNGRDQVRFAGAAVMTQVRLSPNASASRSHMVAPICQGTNSASP